VLINGGVDVLDFSSDFVCRGGIGGGRGSFDSLSIRRKFSSKKFFSLVVYLQMLNHVSMIELDYPNVELEIN
jgi:hypothetical protein